MANYYCAVRTNYFRVKDPDAFKRFMARVVGAEERVDVWEEEERDEAGNPVFAFGCYGSILGIGIGYDPETDDFDDYDFDGFVNGLSELVADDDAIIILESGHEKLRYVTGSAYVITSTGSSYMDINVLAAQRAAELLKNPGWKTKISY